jgi:ATP-dependent DNA helicase PIF1
VKTVTKTRCEVLVTAEVGTQSGKARKAHELGKPVISADEFLAWVKSGGSIERASRGAP